MRAQLLRALQRLPQAATANEGLQSFRAFSGSSLLNDGNSLLSTLQGKKEEGIAGPRAFAFKQLSQSPLSFAAHLSTLKEEESKEQQQVALKEVPKVPLALTALPARPNSQSLAAVQQRTTALAQAKAYGTAAAHADDDHHAVDHAKYHPFHVLPPSPWPLLGGWGAGVTCLGMTAWFHGIPGGTQLMLYGLVNNIATATAWWRDCIIESDMGMHTDIVKKNLISGVWLFIVSEAMLFFGLLWSCIHLGMSPNVYVQMQWPPVGVIPVGWDKRALVMSAVLAASYYSANVAMVAQNPKTVMAALSTTIGLGAMFLADQYLEYNELPFTITDSPYGSTFFLTTGFHGFHVLLGALWLAVSAKMYSGYKSVGVGMKGAVLYWHFVDIVWIAVYGIIYVGQF